MGLLGDCHGASGLLAGCCEAFRRLVPGSRLANVKLWLGGRPDVASRLWMCGWAAADRRPMTVDRRALGSCVQHH